MREIIQLKDGKEVKRYQSQHNASQETGLPQCNISACLNRHRRTCGGFTWEYAYNKVSLDLKRVEQLIGEGYLINEALFLLGIDYWYYSRHVSPERRKELLLSLAPDTIHRIYSKPHSITRYGTASKHSRDKFIYNAY